ncbi:hypothetical protein PVAG01_09160 [Phlyctema vagabunda]|uniref:Uncharacterized protein n=1 Tax=Phlyctema vagabunda TaxID=108571 RepID=A0ABR4P6K1_9HELO
MVIELKKLRNCIFGFLTSLPSSLLSFDTIRITHILFVLESTK